MKTEMASCSVRLGIGENRDESYSVSSGIGENRDGTLFCAVGYR